MQLAARSTINRFPTLDQVQDAERTAIETEQPLFNRQWNDTPEARERLRDYLTGIGRVDLIPARERNDSEDPAPVSAPRATADHPTLIGDGKWRIEVRRGGGVILGISDGIISTTFRLPPYIALDIADALKHHGTEETWAFMRHTPAA